MTSAPGRRRAAYDPAEIQRLERSGRYSLTRSAQRSAAALGIRIDGVLACVEELEEADFYKSMHSARMPGLWQDVYCPTFAGFRLYVKLQIDRSNLAVVISFKER